MMLLNFTIFIILSENDMIRFLSSLLQNYNAQSYFVLINMSLTIFRYSSQSKIYSNILLVEIKIIMLWNVFDATQNVLNTRGI